MPRFLNALRCYVVRYSCAELPWKVLLVSVYSILAYMLLYSYHWEQQRTRRIQFTGFFTLLERCKNSACAPLVRCLFFLFLLVY